MDIFLIKNDQMLSFHLFRYKTVSADLVYVLCTLRGAVL